MELTPDLYILSADGITCPAYEYRERLAGGRLAVSYTVEHPTAGTVNLTAARVAELRAEGRVSETSPAPAPLALVTEAPRRIYPGAYRVARTCRATRRTLEVLASGLSHDTASRLAQTLREQDDDDRFGVSVQSMPLSDQIALAEAAGLLLCDPTSPAYRFAA